MQWYTPWAFLLFLTLPVVGWAMLRRKRAAAVKFPSLIDMQACPVSWRLRLRPVLVAVRLLCLALLILALARPRKGTVLSELSTEGVAIQAVVDRSGSMAAEMDYDGQKFDRLEVVKRVLADFVEGDRKGLGGRTGDLIGLITFARYADTVCPLVLSHSILSEFLRTTEIVSIRSEDGTAIGDAIALAAARLKTAEEELRRRNAQLGFGDAQSPENKRGGFEIKSKVIILLTDGRNNMGDYEPLAAAELAAQWGITIYTIGIGSAQSFATVQTMLGTFRMPTRDDLDEGLLEEIAKKTGGFYSRATDAESLRDIVRRIDALEKTEMKSVQYTQYAERFGRWTLPALLLLGLEMVAGCTIFRKIP
ncbi:VWA domain-containing protein [Anaerobaca lacustris]|uniref:VWA domain-containing protein n=1 Tax=Anaerobaca lacustris TaxID=3044600 RepID=A0AAW6TXX5_9BACT|nr:VWA domain-containing protein [Sedimentisphaerales bacterium M17dextr]